MNLTEIADAIFRLPSVEEGFLQQQEALDKNDFAPVSGSGPGAKKSKIVRSTKFRIWIRAGGKFCDLTHDTLIEALRAAFTATKIDPAAVLTELKERQAYVSKNPPKPKGNAEDQAEAKREWEGMCAGLKQSIMLIDDLAEWMSDK